MKRAVIAALGATLVAVLAVAFASAAVPKQGRLVVSNPANNVGTAGQISLTNVLAPNTFRTTIYVPAGYRAPGDVGAIGNNVGKAQVYVRTASGSRITLNGAISVVNAAQYPDTTCSTAKHHEVWVVKAKQDKGTATVEFPVFVDTPDTNPSMPATAAYTLQYCTGNRGLNITQVDLDLVRMFVNPQARGTYLWRAVYDAATADGKGIASGSSTGVAAAVPLSTEVTMKVNAVPKHRFWKTITGSVNIADKGLGHVKVQVFVGHSRKLALNRPKATVWTKADGSYRVVLRLAKGTWYVRTKASTPYRDVTAGGGCSTVTDSLATKNCVDATLSSFVVVSNPLTRLALR